MRQSASVDLSKAQWCKSSRSGANGNCVEVAFVDGNVAVRDSKNLDQQPLIFTPAEWHAFVKGVQAGELTGDM